MKNANCCAIKLTPAKGYFDSTVDNIITEKYRATKISRDFGNCGNDLKSNPYIFKNIIPSNVKSTKCTTDLKVLSTSPSNVNNEIIMIAIINFSSKIKLSVIISRIGKAKSIFSPIMIVGRLSTTDNIKKR
jgi:hypothetical protein